jgi:hypothetical protein
MPFGRILGTLGIIFPLLLSPALTLADEEPVAGKETFKTFTDAIQGIPLSVPTLAVPYAQPLWGVSVPHPEDWLSQEKTKTTTKLYTSFYPMTSNAKIAGSISLTSFKKSVPQSLVTLEKMFDDRAFMSGGTESIGDWYIPSLGNLGRSDVTIAGLPGRQFMYTSFRNGEHYIGVTRMFFLGNVVYDFSMFAPSGSATKVYAIFDQMAQNLSVGAAPTAKDPRAAPSVRNSRLSSSTSSRPAVTCKPKTRNCASSISSRSVKRQRASILRKSSSSSSSSSSTR